MQGRGYALGRLNPQCPFELHRLATDTTLAAPAGGRRPLAGVIPGHDSVAPRTLYRGEWQNVEGANCAIAQTRIATKVEN